MSFVVCSNSSVGGCRNAAVKARGSWAWSLVLGPSDALRPLGDRRRQSRSTFPRGCSFASSLRDAAVFWRW